MSLSSSANPLVSVIVPNFNNAQYLSECLDSVLAQTYKNIEIVCIDDASTDNSVAIIRQYVQRYPNIVLIENETNLGISQNRHKAIMASQGAYFTTLDSDDFFISSQKIAKELAVIQASESKYTSGVVAFSDIRLVDADSQELFPKAVNKVKEGNIFKEIFLRKCLIPRDYLLSKQLYFEAGGFDSEIPLYEDWDLKIRLSHRCNFIYSGVKGIGYRRHGAGLSSVDGENHVRWLCHIFNKNIGLIPKSEIEDYQTGFADFLDTAFSEKNAIKRISPSLFKKITTLLRTIF